MDVTYANAEKCMQIHLMPFDPLIDFNVRPPSCHVQSRKKISFSSFRLVVGQFDKKNQPIQSNRERISATADGRNSCPIGSPKVNQPPGFDKKS